MAYGWRLPKGPSKFIVTFKHSTITVPIIFLCMSIGFIYIASLGSYDAVFIAIVVPRATRKSDLVMPDQARAVARDLGVCYYETSVFTYYGVNEVFENSIRAALIARRQQRFWMTNLKRVQRPLLQVESV